MNRNKQLLHNQTTPTIGEYGAGVGVEDSVDVFDT